MRGKKGTLILLVIFSIGLSILLYPTISQYWNSKVQSKAIISYDNMLDNKMKEEEFTELLKKGEQYNQKLFELDFPLTQYKKIKNTSNIINVNKSGMIGYISIPKLRLEIPIYYGTSAEVLNNAVGNLEGTSLPIGGKNTHSVLSAHRGLVNAKLFTDLNKLAIGDIFIITVLNQKLTYQIDNIMIVKPTDTSNLMIYEGEDYVTLLTCTPYGLNTHRLLVRGTRIESSSNLKNDVTSDAYLIDKLMVTAVIAFSILFILIIYVIFKPSKKKISIKKEGI